MKDATVLWFTGMSGSGKTTIARALSEAFSARGLTSKIIDGDDIRANQHAHLGFTPEDIKENNRLIAELCVRNRGQYDYILVPIISPFRQSREQARNIIGDKFRDIYVKISLEGVIRRDVKGLYKKALNGEIKNFIGIDPNVPYEEPMHPSVIVDSEQEHLHRCVWKILNYLGMTEKIMPFSENGEAGVVGNRSL